MYVIDTVEPFIYSMYTSGPDKALPDFWREARLAALI